MYSTLYRFFRVGRRQKCDLGKLPIHDTRALEARCANVHYCTVWNLNSCLFWTCRNRHPRNLAVLILQSHGCRLRRYTACLESAMWGPAVDTVSLTSHLRYIPCRMGSRQRVLPKSSPDCNFKWTPDQNFNAPNHVGKGYKAWCCYHTRL